MKSWFKKYRISAALDEGRPSSVTPESTEASRDDTARFEAALRRLDHRLKSERPDEAIPETLHASIMNAVRGTSRDGALWHEPQGPARVWRWLAAPGLALLLAGLFLSFYLNTTEEAESISGEPTESLKAAAATLEMGSAVTRSAPSAALAPLEKELGFVTEDARKATELILGSLEGTVAFAETHPSRSNR